MKKKNEYFALSDDMIWKLGESGSKEYGYAVEEKPYRYEMKSAYSFKVLQVLNPLRRVYFNGHRLFRRRRYLTLLFSSFLIDQVVLVSYRGGFLAVLSIGILHRNSTSSSTHTRLPPIVIRCFGAPALMHRYARNTIYKNHSHFALLACF